MFNEGVAMDEGGCVCFLMMHVMSAIPRQYAQSVFTCFPSHISACQIQSWALWETAAVVLLVVRTSTVHADWAVVSPKRLETQGTAPNIDAVMRLTRETF